MLGGECSFHWIRNLIVSVAMERDTAAQLRRRSSKSPDLAHLAYSMHVAAANGDKRRVKRCLKAGILEYSEPERNAVGASVGTL